MSGILTVVVSVTIIYFVCLYLNYRDSGKWRWGPPEEEKRRHQMTPAVRKLVEAIRSSRPHINIHMSVDPYLSIEAAISAVEAEAATGERNPHGYEKSFTVEQHRDELIDRLGSAIKQINAAESKLTAIRALVEKGIPAMEMTDADRDRAKADNLKTNDTGRRVACCYYVRERQFTERLSQIGSILNRGK